MEVKSLVVATPRSRDLALLFEHHVLDACPGEAGRRRETRSARADDDGIYVNGHEARLAQCREPRRIIGARCERAAIP
jgi:hypothetical protein